MNTQIQSFHFENQSVRVVLDDSHTPMFVAKDVAITLGYARPNDAIKQHCKGAVKHRTLETNGGNQKMRVIYEPDVYRLIFGSKLESAVKFQDWVFEEVLPTIRKTGQYTIAFATKDERKPLVQAVNLLVGETGMIYSTVWKMIHQRFGVDCVDELTNEQVYQAVEYVHGLILQQGKNPVDDAMLYKVLVDSAIFLREYAHLIRQLNGVRLFDDKMGRHTCKVLVDHINDIFRLAHDMELTNKNGRPMFEKNRINYYVGGYMPIGV